MADTLGSAADSGTTSAGKCPVDFETRSLWSLWGKTKKESNSNDAKTNNGNNASAIPASLEEAARYAQTPRPGQRLPLSTHRLESTIPRNGTKRQPEDTPAHQIHVANNNASAEAPSDTWVYPSEQQVFNAMKRKGWNHVEEESIPSFLQIHNSVNERSWTQVQDWEERSGVPRESLELSRFEGRPKDLSPKAWFLSTLGIRDKPFDRHDWYVVQNPESNNNGNGTVLQDRPEKRYVLDFYMTEESNGQSDLRGPPGMPRVEIDVRPALDSPEAIFQRGTGLLREAFPGMARELDSVLRHL